MSPAVLAIRTLLHITQGLASEKKWGLTWRVRVRGLGLGFRGEGLGLRVWGQGFRVSK